MKNMPFVIWMLGWPFIFDLSGYIKKYVGLEYEEPKPDSILVMLVIWFFVGVMLYE